MTVKFDSIKFSSVLYQAQQLHPVQYPELQHTCKQQNHFTAICHSWQIMKTSTQCACLLLMLRITSYAKSNIGNSCRVTWFLIQKLTRKYTSAWIVTCIRMWHTPVCRWHTVHNQWMHCIFTESFLAQMSSTEGCHKGWNVAVICVAMSQLACTINTTGLRFAVLVVRQSPAGTILDVPYLLGQQNVCMEFYLSNIRTQC